MWTLKTFNRFNKLIGVSKLSFYKKTIIDTCIFVLTVIIVFIPYLVMNYKSILHYDVITIVALFLAFSWTFLGPLCINNFFLKIRRFIDNVDKTRNNENDVIPDSDTPVTASDVYNSINTKLFKKLNIFIFIFWDGILMITLLLNSERMRHFNFFGYHDIYYWILLIYISFIAYLQSIGFTELIICHLLINKLLKDETLIQNVIESDFNNGIELFGSIVITTTLSFFSGIVYFPILLVFCSDQSPSIYGFVIILMFVFLASLLSYFLLSYYKIWKCAQERKDSLINEFKSIYNVRMYNSINGCIQKPLDIIINELKIHNINAHIQELKSINVYPIVISKSISVIAALIFPALFFMTDFIEAVQTIASFFTK